MRAQTVHRPKHPEVREDHSLTEVDSQKKLGISTSYLNQIENNQRHVTAPVLLALAEVFSVDIATLSVDDSGRLLADMAEALAELDDTLERTGGLNEPTPYEEVRDFFHLHRQLRP